MRRTESAASPQPLAEFRLTRTVAVQWLVAAVVGFFVSAYCFGHVRAAIRGEPLEPIVVAASPPGIHRWLAVSLGLVAIVVVCHELLHGVCMARYGGDAGYGLGVSYFVLPYAYAETEASFTRSQLIVTLLVPFVGITAVGLLAMVVFPSSALIVALAANAAGSIGDCWMAATLLQYPPSVRVTELEDGADVQGFAIHGSASDGSSDRTARRLAGADALSRAVVGAVATLALLLGFAIVAVLTSLAVDTGTVVIGEPTGRWFLFRHELRGGNAILEIGTSLVAAVTALGGLGWAILGSLADR